jgi:glycosyltransferase involved in cell wall biosynthesis
MSTRRTKKQNAGSVRALKALPRRYLEACRFAEQGQHELARQIYSKLARGATNSKARLLALIQNDLAVLNALEGKLEEALQGCEKAVELDVGLLQARLNRDLLEAEISLLEPGERPGDVKLAPAPTATLSSGSARVSDAAIAQSGAPRESLADGPSGVTGVRPAGSPIRIAILSFLFNWPSTGGGNMHTAGLVEFLARAGYDVRHYYANYPAWRIGRVGHDELVHSEAIPFDDASWDVATIQERYRQTVGRFNPDWVAITDAWNMKPHLAEALRGYPTFLLWQAQECLCLLNNLRILGIGPSQVEQCPRNQLATPEICHRCLTDRGHHSGALHQHERALAGVGTPEYDHKLRKSLHEAEAVLALNPLTAAMLEPYARCVRIVPWGIDSARFPWPTSEQPQRTPGQPARLFMAAVAGEFIKGFHVAHEACRLLRQVRSDFELVVTFDPPGQIDEFTRSVGWCSQAELPQHYREADICLVPTIAQDGLSITSVEAMASGIPVIASRIGGLPYTVSDGVTGLLCEPGDPVDLARQITRLLDDEPLRRQMGLAGRQRFEQDFTWEIVVERYWRPLLARRAKAE